MFLTLLLLAAVFVISELLRPKPQFEDARPSVLGDFQFPTATQDRKVPLVFGTVRQKGANVTWYGDLQQIPITEKVKTGLFSSETITKGFSYNVGIMFGISRGDDTVPVELRGIWVGDDKVFTGSVSSGGSTLIDEPELFGGNDLGNGGVVGTVSWQGGTTTQAVNSYLDGTTELQIGGQTPRFTGTAYAVFEGGYIGNSTSIKPWSFEIRRIANPLGLGTASVNGGNDMNPMNVAYELLTNSEWGFGYAAAKVDTANFTSAATALLAEGNGFSMLVDREMTASDFLDEIARQIDGVFFVDHRTGKWTVQLAREPGHAQFGYDIDTVHQLTSPIKVENFKVGDIQDTTNVVQVAFGNRDLDYSGDTATAKDISNALIQGGGTVATVKSITAKQNYPGIKNATLAARVATRDLTTLSTPLIVADIEVDRSFWDVIPGGVIAWTDSNRFGSKRAFRINRVDYGNLQQDRIKLSIVEDVFQFAAGIAGAPPPTQWTPPSSTPVSIPSDEQIAFEAPRGIVFRGTGASTSPLFWAGGRRTNGAVTFKITERHASGTPSGSFSEVGESFAFMLVGNLANSLSKGTAIPTATIDVDPDPETQSVLEAAFTDSTDPVDVGTNLVNLILVGSEFMLASSAAINGGNVRLSNVYRGVLDSAQEDHSASDPVYLLVGNLADNAIPETDNVDVRLLPRTRSATLASASATTIAFQMAKRIRRPYCPGRISLDGTAYKTSTTLEGNGSGPEDFGIDLDFIRRDYRTGDGGDEIAALTTDAATLFPDYPSANSTDHDVDAIDDPDGTPTSLFTDVDVIGNSHTVRRIDILAQTDGVIPSRMSLEISSKHDDGPDTDLVSRNVAKHDFDTSSALTGDFNFGARSDGVASNTYTADAAGTHSFSLSTALPGGEDVEYRIDTGGGFGAWTTLIAGGGTGPGTIAGVGVGDLIEVRHQGTASSIRKQLTMTAPGAGTDGYFILVE